MIAYVIDTTITLSATPTAMTVTDTDVIDSAFWVNSFDAGHNIVANRHEVVVDQ